MRNSRILLVSAAACAVAVLTPSAASAAPATSPTHIAAPYTTTYTGGVVHCRTGATCTPRSSAVATTGHITAGIDVQRTSPDETATESGLGYADEVLDVQAPKGARHLTATFSWTVRSATTSARADHGVLFASTLMYAEASCSGCTSNSTNAELVSSSSTVPGSDNTNTVSDVQKTVTISVDNLPTRGTIRLYSGGSAYADMNPEYVCTGLPGCDALPPIDAGHSGTAHAALDATLVSVDVSYS